MHRVEPKIFLIGETQINESGMRGYLTHVGAADWNSDAHSHSEKLIEFYGRLCYRSWAPKMNPNVTKVREGNDKYIAHIIEVGHGSVMEHAVSNWVFADISRVATHEIVRHRVGTMFSQESLRFVRLTDLGLWLPAEIEADPLLKELFKTTFESLEQLQHRMSEHLKLDEEKNFARKKQFTSAMRRIAPIGLATTLGVSFNIRALRHVIFMRTSRHAEVEMRVIFNRVAEMAKYQWPNLFADFTAEEIDGINEWTTPHVKV